VQGFLNTLKIDSGESCVTQEPHVPQWDEFKLKQLQAELEAGGGRTSIVGTDGNTYEISTEHISIEQKTEKIHGRDICYYLHNGLLVVLFFPPFVCGCVWVGGGFQTHNP
jgi:hypothetical protein